MKKEIKTEITIKATPEKVWAILTDFDDYPHWNPFIKSLCGDATVGNKIKIELNHSDGKTMTFKPKVLVFNKPKEFRWIGHLWVKGLFDGEHKFELIENEKGGTLFKQSEKMSGILLPLFRKQIETKTQKGFENMNKELKKKAEEKNK